MPTRSIETAQHAVAEYRRQPLHVRTLRRLGRRGYPAAELTMVRRHEMGSYGRLSDGIQAAAAVTRLAVKKGNELPVAGLEWEGTQPTTFWANVTPDMQATVVRVEAALARDRHLNSERIDPDTVSKIGFGVEVPGWRRYPGQRYREAGRLALYAQIDKGTGMTSSVPIQFGREDFELPTLAPYARELEGAVDHVAATARTALINTVELLGNRFDRWRLGA